MLQEGGNRRLPFAKNYKARWQSAVQNILKTFHSVHGPPKLDYASCVFWKA